MSDNTLEYIKFGLQKSQMLGLKAIHSELENKSLSLTIRDVLSKGMENYETSFLLKDSVDSNLNQFRNDLKNLEKDYKSQSNRIAQLEIKTLTEVSILTSLMKHFVEYGSLSNEEIERISIASKRELFQRLNSKKED